MKMEGNVTLEFNLPDQQQSLDYALMGEKLVLLLWDLDQWVRSEIKYRDKEHLEEVRDKIIELKQEYGLTNIFYNL